MMGASPVPMRFAAMNKKDAPMSQHDRNLHHAYARTRSLVESPRASERRLFAEVNGELAAARDAGLTGAALMAALFRNRQLWAMLSADCGAAGNGLPASVRAGIISLALWVDRHTSEVVRGRESIDALIDINETVMAGLNG